MAEAEAGEQKGERLEAPVERVEAQWCGEWPRATAHATSWLSVHVLGATVHQTPSGRRVFETALFFERTDVGTDQQVCESFVGSQWLRLQCSVSGISVPASTLSGVPSASVGARQKVLEALALVGHSFASFFHRHLGKEVVTEHPSCSPMSGFGWMKPMKSNLVACVLPRSVQYPAVVAVDLLAAEGSFLQPLLIELCGVPGRARGAVVCTEPLHGLHGSRAVADSVEHHLKIGFQVDLYDADGTGEDAFRRWEHTGRLRYFPRFVRTHLGERLAGAEAAAIHDPTAGCSLGFQEIHCLFRHRGRSRWVAPRLDPDEYFYTPRRSNESSVLSALSALEGARHAFIPSFEFGGAPAASRARAVPERFFLHSGIANPRWTVLSSRGGPA
ncbi:unnamed protein product [Prorocentrum cordatum]|uniref:Type II protein arginine methyltransferase n=1 Tax=Prorocentrum cordatum TaxID=2364126 RepID=A0ABN9UJJ1_9DINO|nr:unnamed protein product [Polarella glacialis]